MEMYEDDFIQTGLKVVIFKQDPIESTIWELRTGNPDELHFYNMRTAAIGQSISVGGEKYIVKDVNVLLLDGSWVIRIYV
jgi:hypothetical protein